MPVDLVIGLVAFTVVTAVFVSVRMRIVAAEVAAAFAGVVTDRRVEEVALTTGLRQDRWLVIRTEGGDVLRVPVSPEVYDRFAVGDRIVKRTGERWPEPG